MKLATGGLLAGWLTVTPVEARGWSPTVTGSLSLSWSWTSTDCTRTVYVPAGMTGVVYE